MQQQANYIHHLSDSYAVRVSICLRMNHVNLNTNRSFGLSYKSGVATTLSPAESKARTKDYNKPPTYTDISPHAINISS